MRGDWQRPAAQRTCQAVRPRCRCFASALQGKASRAALCYADMSAPPFCLALSSSAGSSVAHLARASGILQQNQPIRNCLKGNFCLDTPSASLNILVGKLSVANVTALPTPTAQHKAKDSPGFHARCAQHLASAAVQHLSQSPQLKQRQL